MVQPFSQITVAIFFVKEIIKKIVDGRESILHYEFIL